MKGWEESRLKYLFSFFLPCPVAPRWPCLLWNSRLSSSLLIHNTLWVPVSTFPFAPLAWAWQWHFCDSRLLQAARSCAYNPLLSTPSPCYDGGKCLLLGCFSQPPWELPWCNVKPDPQEEGRERMEETVHCTLGGGKFNKGMTRPVLGS